jgi:hypothetical protein
MRLTTSRRLILRLLTPIPRSFDNRLNLSPSMPRLLGENPLQPLGRGLACLLESRLL